MDEKETEKFYNSIADKYDWLFSNWKQTMEDEMKIIVPVLRERKVKTVLDCACGTGLQSVGLLKANFKVIASDLSEKMLEQAVLNAGKEGFDLPTVRLDFRNLDSHLSEKFDAVLCMGNSLPHMSTDEDVKAALQSMYNVLGETGVLIVEIRNFNQLRDANERFLPIKVNAEHQGNYVTILYVLDFLENVNRFNVIYIIQNQKTKEHRMAVHSIDYNPLDEGKLERLMKEIGFSKIQVKSRPYFFILIGYK